MWTDPTGLERQGELIDTATVDHPKAGRTVASLYLVPADPAIGRLAQYHIELHAGGKTHERIAPSLAEGVALMRKFRGE